jgi:hypothetical protein
MINSEFRIRKYETANSEESRLKIETKLIGYIGALTCPQTVQLKIIDKMIQQNTHIQHSGNICELLFNGRSWQPTNYYILLALKIQIKIGLFG